MNMIFRDVRNEKDAVINLGSQILVNGVLFSVGSIDTRTRHITITPMSADHCREYAAKNPVVESVKDLAAVQAVLDAKADELQKLEEGLRDWEKQLTVRADQMEQDQRNRENLLSAAEAVFGFGAWLTGLSTPLTVGHNEDSAPVAELCSDFVNVHRLVPCREGWETRLVSIAGKQEFPQDTTSPGQG